MVRFSKFIHLHKAGKLLDMTELGLSPCFGVKILQH